MEIQTYLKERLEKSQIKSIKSKEIYVSQMFFNFDKLKKNLMRNSNKANYTKEIALQETLKPGFH